MLRPMKLREWLRSHRPHHDTFWLNVGIVLAVAAFLFFVFFAGWHARGLS